MKVSSRALKMALEIEGLFGTDIMLAAKGPLSADKRPMTMDEIREWIGDCKKCPLHKGRTHIVLGEGNPKARLVFVGEGPGADEDIQGRPFVGRAGQMLTKIIENVLLMRREDAYIANVVKCRPPGNRTPLPDECATCMPYLRRQLESINPEVIVALGSIAARNLLETDAQIGRMRGRFFNYGKIKLMPTYHTAYLLRNPAEKRKVYEDMLLVRDALGIKPR